MSAVNPEPRDPGKPATGTPGGDTASRTTSTLPLDQKSTVREPGSFGDGERERIPSPGDKPLPARPRTGRTPPGFPVLPGTRVTLVPRSAVLTAAPWVLVPALVWILALATAQRSRDPFLQWATAAAGANPERVVLRPDSPGGDSPVVAVTRQGDRIVGLDLSHGARELWTFSGLPSATLLGTTLNDTVLWVPRRGPYAAAKSGAGTGALLVLWTDPSSSEAHVRITLLDRAGTPLWSGALDSDLAPSSLAWVESPTGGVALAANGTDGQTALLTLETGKSAPPAP